VDAPEGTIAEPMLPSFSSTSTETVGNPLLSKNCLPVIFLMVAINYKFIF
jgi:hypothetical protein